MKDALAVSGICTGAKNILNYLCEKPLESASTLQRFHEASLRRHPLMRFPFRNALKQHYDTQNNRLMLKIHGSAIAQV